MAAAATSGIRHAGAESGAAYPQRCTDPRPHGPHRVPGCDGCGQTAFDCPGPAPADDLPPADFEHLIPAAGS
jgi:hypothetical protein